MLLVGLAFADTPWSTDLATLDPTFRARVDRVITRLEAQGYHPAPSCTYRSPDLQDVIASVGTATQAKGGESCHNHQSGGKPAALAVDLWNGGLGPGVFFGVTSALEEQVPFLRALGAAARAEGLNWGGNWSRKPPWSAWDLGWDPAHVEDPRC